ncbi:MAG: Crp/Fnr family transcriptional regulator [Methylotenera sp.]|nr:Crp/Fnr family transcriptional regulator [Methylotenera sp.]
MPQSNLVSHRNLLLAALPEDDLRHFLLSCHPVHLTIESIINEPSEVIRNVYFPTQSFISLVKPLDGGGLEVGLIGNEGMYGMPIYLGVEIAPFRAIVQGAGTALCLSSQAFALELQHSIALQIQMKRYLYVSMSQLAQTAACNRFHVVEERLARWLLMTRDRSHAMQFHITHAFLAQMLGVRRVGVTKAAGSLQQKKLISYRRGNISILDNAGLERVSCSCYQSDKNIYKQILHR